jgi:hypothetical protein
LDSAIGYGASAAGAGACCLSISGRSARDEASASLWRTVSAGGGGDGDAAARSSSVRGGVDGVGASEASNGVASGASEASGGGDAARGCLGGRRGASGGASLSSALSRQISGLGSRARVWIGFRASEASRGRLKTSDGSNVNAGSPLPDEPLSSSLLPDGDASSSARAAVLSARFDMMMRS